MTEIENSQTAVNNPRTPGDFGAKLTHGSSRDVLSQTRRDLIVMCQTQGEGSAAAHHGFNLVELLQADVMNGPVWGDHPIQQPSRLLERQTAGLQRAMRRPQ
jgi:hypothetical protein